MKIARVALDLPMPGLFDYFCKEGQSLQVGVRVRVPFGRTEKCGLVVEVVSESQLAPDRLRQIAQVLDEQPLIAQPHLDFLVWAAAYYHHPLGEAVLASLPVRLRRGTPQQALGQPGWRLTGDGRRRDLSLLKRAPRQTEVVTQLRHHEGVLTRTQLAALCGNSQSALRALRASGWLEPCSLAPQACEPGGGEPGPALMPEQAQVLAAIDTENPGFAAYVLDGVTGSGKTEVYIRLAEALVARQQRVLVLVPEISLTPQLVERFERRLGGGVVVQHSGLNEGEREAAWQTARQGLAQVVIGTRSAVLAPLPEIGLIIVDEEHDGSLKQQEGFRYSARDLALVRARRANAGAGCAVVLGSATPSLETLRNAQQDRYQHLRMRQRAGGAQAPRLDLLDVRDQPTDAGMSRVLLQQIEARLGRGEQAMVFLNRRGYAPVLTCFDCGWISDCPRCDARQTFHNRSRLLWCHHCGAQRGAPVACPQCASPELHPLGQGTERLQEFLQSRFPQYPLLRIDRDATRRKGSLQRVLAQMHEPGPALLVGTQMLAKGHDFPRVTLVGVLDVDGGLFSADFRAAERTAQLVLQVAGRSGRGEIPGRVLIQTRFPEHELLQTLVHSGYEAFVQAALAERRDALLPPYSHQALLRAEAEQAELPQQFLNAALQAARELDVPQVELWGPVPAPMERRAGRVRVHLLLQSETRAPLHRLLAGLLPVLRGMRQARKVRWSVDVDPIDLF